MRTTQKFGEHGQASKSSKSKILRAVKNFNEPFITPHSVKKTKEPRNDDRKLRNCYGQQLWFSCLSGTSINFYSLRIRGQIDISHMLNWLKTLDLLIQVTRKCYNNHERVQIMFGNLLGTICGKHVWF